MARLLVPGRRSPRWPVDHAAVKGRNVITHPADLHGVPGVVGGDVQQTTDAQKWLQSGDDIWSDQAAIALPMLRPRVREEDANRGKGSRRNTGNEIDDIAFDDSDVAQPATFDCCQHRRNARGVHVDTDDTFAWTQFSDFDQRLATTKADIEHHVAGAVEGVVKRQGWAVDSQPPFRERALVGRHS